MRIEYLQPETGERIAYIEERALHWVDDRGAKFGKKETAMSVMRKRLDEKCNGEYLVKEVFSK